LSVDWRLRWGAMAFATYGLLWVPMLFSPHPLSDPSHGRDLALGANSLEWRLATFLAVASLAPLQLGALALHTHLARTPGRRWSLVGLIWILALVPIFAAFAGFGSFGIPAIGALVAAGHVEALQVLDQLYKEPFVVVPFLAAIMYPWGLVLFAVGIWASRTMARSLSGLLVIAALVSTASFLDVNLAQLAGPFVQIAMGLLLATSLFRASVSPAVPIAGVELSGQRSGLLES
jgi:hypothetical protein